jgi:predicted deacetylase
MQSPPAVLMDVTSIESKKNLINISIDDISPHPLSSFECIKVCEDIIKIYPDIKFTLYIPMGYWRKFDDKNLTTKTEKPLYLHEDPDLCKKLLNLPESNFELCYHGVYHSDSKTNNDEFRNLSYKDACSRFEKMFDIAKKSNLYDRMKKIFRPPNFTMSPEAIRAAYDMKIEQIALSDHERIKKEYEESYAIFGENVSWFNVMYPWKEYKLYEKTSIIFHSCSWSKNYLDNDNAELLLDFLNECNNIEFCFANKIVDNLVVE